MAEIFIAGYKPDPEKGCCEACVFGKGKHSTWCVKTEAPPDERLSVDSAGNRRLSSAGAEIRRRRRQRRRSQKGTSESFRLRPLAP